MECTVHNLSETGVAVVIDEAMPNEFTLVVVSEIRIKKCKFVWRDYNRMDVVDV